MIFHPLPLPGAYRIEPEPRTDERGFFARIWCADEFANHGLQANFVQSSISFNKHRGTLRGLHYQEPPHAETKLVRCIRGAVFDVIVDLRSHSPAYKQWAACELTADNRCALYIPEGIAHGFQTLTDDAELSYEISPSYELTAARGIHWNDPDLAIAWPLSPPSIISERDNQLPHLSR